MRLWYRQPATKWEDALPVGNGRLGAMVFGGIQSELLQLNEDSVWSGQPYYCPSPEMRVRIPEVQALLFEGRYAEATEVAQRTMTSPNDPRYGSYKPLGDLRLGFDALGRAIARYRRSLDLSTAIVTTTFRHGDEAHVREVLCSAADQVLVIRLTCDKPGAVSGRVNLLREHRASTAADGNDLVLGGQCEHEGVRFQGRLRILLEGGRFTTTDDEALIHGADSATLLFAVNTTYRPDDLDAVCREQLDRAAQKTFDELRAAHVADYEQFFRRVEIDLGESDTADLPTDERLCRLQSEPRADDPQLAALYFQYGRYLLIGSSRPGTLPANLQGLWNPLYDPPWFCDYTINVNTEMNYWPAETCNLAELAEPLFDLIDRCLEAGRRAARDRYGCRGWVLSTRTTPWATSELRGNTGLLWQDGAAWLSQSLWDHYEFSRDREFLATRAYPVLRETAEFYLDFLVEHPQYGWLITGPNGSPENSFLVDGKYISISMGTTMSNQLIDDVFRQCIEASEILGVDRELREELMGKRARLAPMQIGRQGQLQEWLEDFEGRPGHRHLSHLYGLHPSNQICPRATPELARAARRALEIRLAQGSGWCGWSAAWIVNLWARLGEGDRAHEALMGLLRTSTFGNLFGNHGRKDGPVFQIDGNLGATAGIAEMLLQSHMGELHLLPALPCAWPRGYARGLRARGAFEVDIEWARGKLTRVVIRSELGGACTVRCGEHTAELDTERAGSYELGPDLAV